jgi:hypothetical protein
MKLLRRRMAVLHSSHAQDKKREEKRRGKEIR